jgi:hypothetical protein
MKLRLAVATLLVTLAAAACTTQNPLAPKAPPTAHMDDNGNWMGSGH